VCVCVSDAAVQYGTLAMYANTHLVLFRDSECIIALGYSLHSKLIRLTLNGGPGTFFIEHLDLTKRIGPRE